MNGGARVVQLSARSVPSALRLLTLGIRIRNLADINLQNSNPTLNELLVLDGIVPVRRLEVPPVASPTDHTVIKDALAVGDEVAVLRALGFWLHFGLGPPITAKLRKYLRISEFRKVQHRKVTNK